MHKIGKLLVVSFALLAALAFTAEGKINRKLLVSTDWLAKNSKKVVVLHVGTNRQSYEAGHIPGARFLAYGSITTVRDGVPNELASVADLEKAFTEVGIGNTRKVVLYGDLNGLAAARAFFTLDYLGHGDRVAILDGGFDKWKKENREISTRAAEPAAEPFTPRVDPRTVVALDTVRDVSWSVVSQKRSNFALIDARPPEEYSGEKPGDGVVRPGHIPGAVNVFWLAGNLVSRENPVMKPVRELRDIYAKAGVADGKTIVVYCRTGGQASHAYFTLRYLGYRPMMYDGSYFQWNKHPDTKVESGAPASLPASRQ
jgi:thiosulfate/3-mercaptopyruvate sulfurtransferase